MAVELKLEKLSGHAKEGKIGKIHKNVGDEIKLGDVLFDIESNKGNLSVKSNANGKIETIEVEEGSTVKIGDLLAKIDGVASQNDPSKATFNYFSGLLKPQKQELESDITIIGGGPGGYVAAIAAAKLGAKVVLVEKEKLGGTCLNWGCIPTKSLVRSAEVYKNLKEADTYGLSAENISVNMKKIVERKNNIVNQLVQGISYLLEKNHVTVINGMGEILDHETVSVKNKKIEATIKSKNIIIATGSTSSSLPIPGIDLENVITSKEALDLNTLPDKLAIVGGGVIGMEFAFIYANLGVDVSVIEFLDNILASLDDDVCTEISQIAKDMGIKLYTSSKLASIIESEDGECIVSFHKDNKLKFITADKVLMAVGRKPVFEGIDIEKLGIELTENKKGIKVNEKLQTNIPNIYAIGDVTNKIQLAHVASHQGIVAVKNILGKDLQMDYTVIPSAIFTDPEIAMVGIGEKMAHEKGIEIEVGKFPFAANGKALTLGENKGFVKIIKEKSTNKVIGATIIGPHATDLIAEIALAIKNELTIEQIAETIHAHPTTAESIHEAVLATEGGAIHFA
ncbi:dihydrolipoyl dehydrogenase [Crassaminicella thermophila]|uniref:Dihydrolipoyl dehydrogenase n=1 Tax=Crassaminicella thermophila TaxID=2599308 RepID=A0A5C0S9Y4_CRATE|nr:dihydrolipoyl dehydrogenase [Crassaminicella thermophila]QEK11373.1 dihydrolipoyl dehydrogenase [Crassaminicella thermophila]